MKQQNLLSMLLKSKDDPVVETKKRNKVIEDEDEGIQKPIAQLSIKQFKEEKSVPVSESKNIQQPKSQQGLLPINDPKYHIINDSPFNKGQSVPFSFVCQTFEAVGECSGVNSKEIMKEYISRMFRSIMILTPDVLIPTYYFSILKLSPDYQNSELGIGQGILVKCISRVSGRTDKKTRESLNQLGDLGLVVEKSKGSQSTVDKFFIKKTPTENIAKQISMVEIYDTLVKLSETKGQDSANEKERVLEGLLRKCQPLEAKFQQNENILQRYIVRFIEKNHKIGAGEKTMQTALAKAFYLHFTKDSKIPNENDVTVEDFEISINSALCECPNYNLIINSLKTIGLKIKSLKKICHIMPGIPCKPMLAKPMKSIQMIFHRFENMKFTCEYKYDGLRGQIHYNKGNVYINISIFSRNLENMTEAYPDICNFLINYVQSHQEIESFIIDSEIVAFDAKTMRILPFQVLSTRARKNVEAQQIEVKVCLFLFDLLYLNGKSYLSSPLIERRIILKSNFKPVEGQMMYAESKDSESFEEIEEFLIQSVRIGCEGLMIKTLEENAQYEPAKRSLNWLKLKKDYLDSGLGDTFDLVPIGALKGTGKRLSIKKGLYGSYLLACYNDDMEVFEPICKIGTGFSDDDLEKFYNKMQNYIIKEPLQEYKCENIQMDVWFRPNLVWEVKGADIQISPIYTACRTYLDGEKGVGLRFPRLIKLREDKKPEEATTSSFIFDIYQQQAVVKNQSKINDLDDDYY